MYYIATDAIVILDVFRKTTEDAIAVAHAVGGRADPPVFVGAIGSRHSDIDQLLRRRHAVEIALWGK